MFEFGRELRRFFGVDTFSAHRDGLTGGDQSLLELLDLRLLHNEARSCDVAAGRISAKDRAQRKLEAAIAWREVARRSGDAVALRKAAATAEGAAELFDRRRRPDGWARARCEQAYCAMLGAELYGDEGLNAAAEIAFREAAQATRGGLARALSDIGLLAVDALTRPAPKDAQSARIAAARFVQPIAELNAQTRRVRAARVLAVEARMVRTELLLGWGARLVDQGLLQDALTEAELALDVLQAEYEPVTHARATSLKGQALVLLGEMTGQAESLLDGVNLLSGLLKEFSKDQSPMDWARIQTALAQALQALGEATASEQAFEQAVTCYDRANTVFKTVPALALGAFATSNRAVCLSRSAELSGDLTVLDAAEAAFRMELLGFAAGRNPTAWALLQVNLARLYEARMDITGVDKGERAAAATALSAALDVFSEQGLRSLSVIASDALERLSNSARARANPSRT
ncbi:MAG: hypothetical protein CFE28_13845 [Alphaproteobacteria bacterium PA2]|nr:MAG: hypothetical protein CFE28_13845 [Alphaproteobacteria bacterium PA2]